MAKKTSFETQQMRQRAILVLINVKNQVAEPEENLIELTALCEAACLEPAGTIVQNTNEPSLAYLIGTGKLDELKEMVKETNAELVVFDNDLSGSRLKNLAEALDVRVIDRNMLILDIFAARAVTAEGQLQTELAQLKYLMPRLAAAAGAGNRYGAGGVGMRGPGESKLELDSRRIKDRVFRLEQQLKKVEAARNLKNKNMAAGGSKKVALVGYTNAGKSTILNTITKTGVLAKDMLFATLDTTSREVWLGQGTRGEPYRIVLSDTVGFVSRLPHEFVEAFKSTLAVAVEAQLLLIVVDAADPSAHHQLAVVLDVLNGLKAADIPRIIVLNKCDKTDAAQLSSLEGKIKAGIAPIAAAANRNSSAEPHAETIIRISAKNNFGLDELKQSIIQKLFI